MANHKELDVWKESMLLAKWIYAITSKFPKQESFGLTSQMRRCSVSVPSNIAEGAARNRTLHLSPLTDYSFARSVPSK